MNDVDSRRFRSLASVLHFADQYRPSTSFGVDEWDAMCDAMLVLAAEVNRLRARTASEPPIEQVVTAGASIREDEASVDGGHVSDLLTDAELRAMDITVELVNVMCRDVIGRGKTRDNDVREFVHHVHCIQQAILSQAAGRAYPERFRTLGETSA